MSDPTAEQIARERERARFIRSCATGDLEAVVGELRAELAVRRVLHRRAAFADTSDAMMHLDLDDFDAELARRRELTTTGDK